MWKSCGRNSKYPPFPHRYTSLDIQVPLLTNRDKKEPFAAFAETITNVSKVASMAKEHAAIAAFDAIETLLPVR